MGLKSLVFDKFTRKLGAISQHVFGSITLNCSECTQILYSPWLFWPLAHVGSNFDDPAMALNLVLFYHTAVKSFLVASLKRFYLVT